MVRTKRTNGSSSSTNDHQSITGPKSSKRDDETTTKWLGPAKRAMMNALSSIVSINDDDEDEVVMNVPPPPPITKSARKRMSEKKTDEKKRRKISVIKEEEREKKEVEEERKILKELKLPIPGDDDDATTKKQKKIRRKKIAQRELRKWMNNKIPLAAPRVMFERMARETIHDILTVTNESEVSRITPVAVKALQEGSERYIVEFFDGIMCIAKNAGRDGPLPKDIQTFFDVHHQRMGRCRFVVPDAYKCNYGVIQEWKAEKKRINDERKERSLEN